MDLPDKRCLEAAQGWLGLGNLVEANEELERIDPKMRVHPDVLCMRYTIYSLAKKWELAAEVARVLSEIEPDVSLRWIAYAKSLHELKRTKEAYGVLLPVADKFPAEEMIPYSLACYACQLGNLKEALQWLEKAIDLAGKGDIRQMALDEKDLEPLWLQISEI
jgi:tetratricopeptide (TPR) repeat protein